MQTLNEEMTPEKLIEHCNRLARGNIDPANETDFRIHTDRGVVQEQRKLHKIHNLNGYINAYSEMYQKIKSSAPERIVIRDLFLECGEVTGLDNYQDKLEFENCKIVIKDTKENSGLRCRLLRGCDVDLQERVANVHVEACEKSVFRRRATLSHSKGRGEQYKIESCIFEESLACNSAYVLKNNTVKKDLASGSGYDVRIVKCTIGYANFGSSSDLIIEDSTLEASNFSGQKVYRRIILANVTFGKPPMLPKDDFGTHNIQFGGLVFKDMQSDEALGAFRQLKALCEKAGYEHGAIIFHGFELEAYYNSHLKNLGFLSPEFPQKALSVAHRMVSDYGRNLLLPFKWILAIMLIMAVVNLLVTYECTCNVWGWINAIKCSLRDSLGPMIFALPSNGNEFCKEIQGIALDTLHFFQIVITSIIWFLIVFMARRRFKL
jgi:hypothetical protein